MLYVVAVSSKDATLPPSIIAVENLERLALTLNNLPRYVSAGYDWSVAKVFQSPDNGTAWTIQLTKSQVFELLEEAAA